MTPSFGHEVIYQVTERARFESWPDKVNTGEEIALSLLRLELLLDEG